MPVPSDTCGLSWIPVGVRWLRGRVVGPSAWCEVRWDMTNALILICLSASFLQHQLKTSRPWEVSSHFLPQTTSNESNFIRRKAFSFY